MKRLFVIALVWALAGGAAAAETTLRVVPSGDLSLLDPINTTAATTKTHGYLVYDVLFAMDAAGRPQPEMIDAYSASASGLTYEFTLRDGQTWHDGTPVTARDAVASLKRWAARAPGGQILMARTASIQAIDTLRFSINLREPDAEILEALADPVSPLFVMRERDALTDPYQSIKEAVGSGPFIFEADKYRPGSQVVYRRNPAYRPRNEPPSGLAGGKVANVDRIVWQIMPDSGVALAALGAGEVDIVENPPFDLMTSLAKNPDIVVRPKDNMGYMAVLRPNQLVPPFNNPKARQALAALVDQQEYLDVMVGRPDYERPCIDPFGCGRAKEPSPASAPRANIDLAKQLFAEAGYRGEPIVVLDPVDLDILHNMTLLTVQNLQKAGLTVDHQTMDWATVLKRRAVKDAPSENRSGWHLIHITIPIEALQDPVTHPFLDASCEGKNWFGWPCDPEIERHRLAFLDAATPSARSSAMTKLRQRFDESLPFVVLGQYYRAVAYRKTVSNLQDGPYMIFWGAKIDH